MIDEEAVSWDHMLLYIERGSHSHISWMCLSMGWLGYDMWISERMALTAGVLLPRGLGVLSRCSPRQLFLFGVVSRPWWKMFISSYKLWAWGIKEPALC